MPGSLSLIGTGLAGGCCARFHGRSPGMPGWARRRPSSVQRGIWCDPGQPEPVGIHVAHVSTLGSCARFVCTAPWRISEYRIDALGIFSARYTYLATC
jgi:hypothetical protein